MIKPQEHNSARELFFQTDHSQAEIARQVGVEAKTVNLWVKNGRWKEIKEAARRTPSILVEQYFTQLAELNNAIANRDEGSRFPTLKEAETMRKLIVCINNIQKQTSLGASIDVVQNFLGRVSSRDNELAQKVIPYANEYLQGKELNGHRPFELAYDVLDHSQSIVNEQSSEIPSLKGDVPASMNIDAEQGDVTTRDEQSPTEIPPSDHSQSIPVPAQTGVNDESLNEQEQVIYLPRCIRDPNDPYTFYYDKITRRTADSPKYGKPPDGFREVPKKDCLDKDYYGKGFGRYNWL